MFIVFQPKNKEITYYLEQLCKSQRSKLDKSKILKIVRKYEQIQLKKTEIIQKYININDHTSEEEIKTENQLELT